MSVKRKRTFLFTYTLDDFDDPKRSEDGTHIVPRNPNDFFANQSRYIIDGTGAVITESLTCPFTYSCYLTLAYDVSAQSSSGWGLSPCLGPLDDPLEPGWGGVGVYRTYGALPKGEPIPPSPYHDGTVCPYAPAGSIVFLGANPAENVAYQALAHWYQAPFRR